MDAQQARHCSEAGDEGGAHRALRSSRTIALAGIGIGLAIVVLMLLIGLIA